MLFIKIAMLGVVQSVFLATWILSQIVMPLPGVY